MKLESLKSGKFAAQVLAPEILHLVSGGQKFETDHFPTGGKDVSNYYRCGPEKQYYDMTVTLDKTNEVVIQGIGDVMFRDTYAEWYK